MSELPPIVHIAGSYVEHVQRCARCGVILIDNRNAMRPLPANGEGWHPGDPDWTPDQPVVEPHFGIGLAVTCEPGFQVVGRGPGAVPCI